MIDSLLCEHQLIDKKGCDLIEIVISIRLEWKYQNDLFSDFPAEHSPNISDADGEIPVPMTLRIMLVVRILSNWP